MIERVMQKPNYNLIKNSAYATVGLIKNDTNSICARVTYRSYLSEGKKAPGYALTIMKTAQNDAYLDDSIKMLHSHSLNAVNTFKKRSENLTVGLSNLNAEYTEAKNALDIEGKKMYPKTWSIRKAILDSYRDNSEQKFPTAKNKSKKKKAIDCMV